MSNHTPLALVLAYLNSLSSAEQAEVFQYDSASVYTDHLANLPQLANYDQMAIEECVDEWMRAYEQANFAD